MVMVWLFTQENNGYKFTDKAIQRILKKKSFNNSNNYSIIS